jgi:hypothetical protein
MTVPLAAVPCTWHEALIVRTDAILVGAIERGSGPPLAVWACTMCVSTYRILPLNDHPRSSNGQPRDRDGNILGRTVLVHSGRTPTTEQPEAEG